MRELNRKPSPYEIHIAVNELAKGRLNNKQQVTLTASTVATAVQDANMHQGAAVFFEPTTSNAAAEQAAGAMYTSDKTSGVFTVSHASNAQTDRIFNYILMG